MIAKSQVAVVMLAFALGGCGGLIPDTTPPPGARPHPAAPTPRPGPSAYVAPGTGIVDQPIDGGTLSRLRQASTSLQQCQAELAAARVTFSPTPDRVNSATCGLTAAGVLGADMGTVARMAPGDVTMTCALAAAVSVWRRQSVEPAAREIFGQDVVEIVHMGTYSCRSVSNRPGARPSAHSRAAAVDFAGVVLRDGRRIMVRDDWHADTDGSRFLKRIRDEGCRVFGTVLSPDYDAPHQDHLHLEPGGRAFCR